MRTLKHTPSARQTLAQRLGIDKAPDQAAGPEPVVSTDLVRALLARHERDSLPRLRMMWSYYRNPMEAAPTINSVGGVANRGYRLAQERGLPSRVVGALNTRGAAAAIIDDRSWSRKEVVIENDIAWRINTMVDFMFARPVRLTSTARDPKVRDAIERALSHVFERSGGAALMQDIGLFGHVYGHVDLIIRVDPDAQQPAQQNTHEAINDGEPSGDAPTPRDGGEQEGPPHDQTTDDAVNAQAGEHSGIERVWIEAVDPTRGVGLPGEGSGADIGVYVRTCDRATRDVQKRSPGDGTPAMVWALRRWWRSESADAKDTFSPKNESFIEVFADGRRQVFRASGTGPGELVEDAPALVEARPGDATPIVHVQNTPIPLRLDGLSEVEPLVPLQDELNTRLSDRASRVTLAAFKMILAKNLDSADKLPVGPGMIWSTDNQDAEVQMFGGDASSPSEDQHIQEIREAMDKISAVPPVAGGVVQAKIGDLSSENALRITLMGLLSKTARKRISYGRGLAQVSALVLEALDRLGELKTSPADRGVRVDWADPLERDELTQLVMAEKKIALGVPRERVLVELGYGPGDPGIV